MKKRLKEVYQTKTQRERIISLLLSVAMVFSMLTQQGLKAHAEEATVGDFVLTSSLTLTQDTDYSYDENNVLTVLTDNVTKISMAAGTLSNPYDENANVTADRIIIGGNVSAIELSGVKIKHDTGIPLSITSSVAVAITFTGENSFEGVATAAINAANEVTFAGEGSLTAVSGGGAAVDAGSNLTTSVASLTATGANGYSAIQTTGNFVMSGGEVNVTASSGASVIGVGGDLSISGGKLSATAGEGQSILSATGTVNISGGSFTDASATSGATSDTVYGVTVAEGYIAYAESDGVWTVFAEGTTILTVDPKYGDYVIYGENNPVTAADLFTVDAKYGDSTDASSSVIYSYITDGADAGTEPSANLPSAVGSYRISVKLPIYIDTATETFYPEKVVEVDKVLTLKSSLSASDFSYTAPPDVNDGATDGKLSWYDGSYSATVETNTEGRVSANDVSKITVYYRTDTTDWATDLPSAVGDYYVAIDVEMVGSSDFASAIKLTDASWKFSIVRIDGNTTLKVDPKYGDYVISDEQNPATAADLFTVEAKYDNEDAPADKISYSYIEDGAEAGTAPSNGLPSAVGSYRIIVTLASYVDEVTNTSYPEKVVEVAKVLKLKLSLSASDFSYTAPSDVNDGKANNTLNWYGGPYPATVTRNAEGRVPADDIKSITVYYSKDQSSWGTTAPSAAGTYYVAIDVVMADSSDYAGESKLAPAGWTFTIASGGVAIVGSLTKEYDGQPVGDPKIITDIDLEAENVEVNVKFYRGEETTPMTDVPVNVGSYKVIVTLSGSGNYNNATADQTFDITAVNLEIQIDESYDPSKTFDGASITGITEAQYTIKSKQTQEEVTGVTPTIAYVNIDTDESYPSADLVKAAGNYKVVVSVAANGNTGSAEVSKSFIIGKQSITISFVDGVFNKLIREYDGSQVGITSSDYIIKDGIGDDKTGDLASKVVVRYKAGNADDESYSTVVPYEAGLYEVEIEVLESENYYGAKIDGVFTINQASGDVELLNNLSKIYDGETIADPVCRAKSTQIPTFSYKLEGEGEDAYSSEKPSSVGKYLLKIDVAGDNNYKAVTKIEAFEISKATMTVEITIAQDKLNQTYENIAGKILTSENIKVYNGGKEVGDKSTLGLVIEYKPARASDDEYTTVQPTEAGAYLVRVTLPETENYAKATATKDFRISKIQGVLEIREKETGNQVDVNTITDLSKVYDKLPFNFLDYYDVYTKDSKGKDTGEVVFEYKSKNGSEDYSTAGAVNAGEYLLKISLIAGENYESVAAIENIPFTIEKAQGSLAIYGWNE